MKARKNKQTETKEPSRCGYKEITLYPHPEMKVAGAGMAMKFGMPAFMDNKVLAARYEFYFFDGIRPLTDKERAVIEEQMKDPEMQGFKGIIYDSHFSL